MAEAVQVRHLTSRNLRTKVSFTYHCRTQSFITGNGVKPHANIHLIPKLVRSTCSDVFDVDGGWEMLTPEVVNVHTRILKSSHQLSKHLVADHVDCLL